MQLEFPDLLQKSDKDKYDFHLKDFTNPHKVTCSQIGALPNSGNQTYTGTLTVSAARWAHMNFRDNTATAGNAMGRLVFSGQYGSGSDCFLQLIVSEDNTGDNRNILQIRRSDTQKTMTESSLQFTVVGKAAADVAQTSTTYNILTSLGGTMGYLNCTGIAKKTVVADDATTQSRFRNIQAGAALPSQLNNGDIFLIY